jgi:hypothetical protein
MTVYSGQVGLTTKEGGNRGTVVEEAREILS